MPESSPIRDFGARILNAIGAPMSVRKKQVIIAVLGTAFLLSLLFVQWMEVERKRVENVEFVRHVPPASSRTCVDCHKNSSPGIVDHWATSTHAAKGVGCVDCHQAQKGDVDAFTHYGSLIATVVTPLDCSRCHPTEAGEFAISHHAKGGNILASLDNLLAERVEGGKHDTADGVRTIFNPHSPTPGRPDITEVNGMASAFTGCHQCHGSKVALKTNDPAHPMINVDDLQPATAEDVKKDPKRNKLGQPKARDDEKQQQALEDLLAKVERNKEGKPSYHEGTWPNSGIGRINLDGSLGSCSACHSRHDFSPRRARQPENCAKCHLGPDHPQKEIYEESKHGVAFRDLHAHMNLNSQKWVLGEDYSQAPTCATCHMSGNKQNGGKVTHNAGERISWTNRPPISLVLDTDAHGKVVTETDPVKRRELVTFSAEKKRDNMKQVCSHCHTPDYVNAFYKQYDDFVVLYNEKFAKPGQSIISELRKQQLITKGDFDEEIEWTWFYLWHHEGRRARHGASMMAPDYAHWHGMYEVAERFYKELIPQAREIAKHAQETGRQQESKAVLDLIQGILDRPEHKWYETEVKKLPKGSAAKSNKEKSP